MKKFLKQLKPDNIEDIIAMNALYRPGPIGFIPLFIKRKWVQQIDSFNLYDFLHYCCSSLEKRGLERFTLINYV
jgi:DNA polymerase-3 subunit alpha